MRRRWKVVREPSDQLITRRDVGRHGASDGRARSKDGIITLLDEAHKRMSRKDVDGEAKTEKNQD